MMSCRAQKRTVVNLPGAKQQRLNKTPLTQPCLETTKPVKRQLKQLRFQRSCEPSVATSQETTQQKPQLSQRNPNVVCSSIWGRCIHVLCGIKNVIMCAYLFIKDIWSNRWNKKLGNTQICSI